MRRSAAHDPGTRLPSRAPSQDAELVGLECPSRCTNLTSWWGPASAPARPGDLLRACVAGGLARGRPKLAGLATHGRNSAVARALLAGSLFRLGPMAASTSQHPDPASLILHGRRLRHCTGWRPKSLTDTDQRRPRRDLPGKLKAPCSRPWMRAYRTGSSNSAAERTRHHACRTGPGPGGGMGKSPEKAAAPGEPRLQP